MAENSKIEWTDHTFNPWSGCTKVSPACANCYAEVNYSVKMRGVKWGKQGNRIIASDSMWKQPLTWNRKAEAEGVRKRVFCASLADVFEGEDTMPADAVDAIRAARRRLGLLILETKNLDWLLLTKRPDNVIRFARDMWVRMDDSFPLPPNVWLGTTVENQAEADKRIPELLKIPAKVRFLSMEPLLGPVDLRNISFAPRLWLDAVTGLRGGDHSLADCASVDWVIAGGESGHRARPMHPDWVRNLRAQCEAANVPFHFKQWGEYWPFDPLYTDEHPFGEVPKDWDPKNEYHWSFENPQVNHSYDYVSVKIGKKAAGRILDGRTWDELPEVAR